MTNLEWIFNNLDDIDLSGSICTIAHISKYHKPCEDKDCFECEFFRNNKKCVKELLQELEGKIKLKQWEYDLISLSREFICCGDTALNNAMVLGSMVEKGYFKGVKNKRMKLDDILDSCIIVADDYEGFEETK